MLARLRYAMQTARAAIDETPPEPLGSQPFGQTSFAVLAYGRVRGSRSYSLDAHVAAAARINARTLLISNDDSLVDVTRLEQVFEHLPLRETYHARLGESATIVEAFLLRRLLHILDKWNVRQCAYLGEDAKTALGPVRPLATQTTFEPYELNL